MTSGATTATRSFHTALREAIADSGLSLESIQRALGTEGVAVGRSTLSFWQNGRRVPTGTDSLRAVNALERVLGLRPESLIRLVPPPSGLGEGKPQPTLAPIRDVMDDFGFGDVLDQWDTRVGLSIVTMNEHRSLASLDVHVVERARSGQSSFVFLFGGEPDADYDQITPSVIAGGRLGRVMRSLSAACVVSEILLDRPPAPGELISLRYRVDCTEISPTDSFVKHASETTIFNSLEVIFHPDAVPVDVVEFERVSYPGPDIVTRHLVGGASHNYGAVRERMRRGIFGLRWSWE